MTPASWLDLVMTTAIALSGGAVLASLVLILLDWLSTPRRRLLADFDYLASAPRCESTDGDHPCLTVSSCVVEITRFADSSGMFGEANFVASERRALCTHHTRRLLASGRRDDSIRSVVVTCPPHARRDDLLPTPAAARRPRVA